MRWWSGMKFCLPGLYYEEETGAYKKGSLKGKREEAEELGVRLAQKLREECKREYDSQ